MPLYDFRCPQGHTFESISPAGPSKQVCLRCGLFAEKVWLRTPAMRGDYAAYDCPITGQRIEGRAAHEANLKKHGCHLWEAGEAQAESRRRAELDRKIDKENDDMVDRVVGELASN